MPTEASMKRLSALEKEKAEKLELPMVIAGLVLNQFTNNVMMLISEKLHVKKQKSETGFHPFPAGHPSELDQPNVQRFGSSGSYFTPPIFNFAQINQVLTPEQLQEIEALHAKAYQIAVDAMAKHIKDALS